MSKGLLGGGVGQQVQRRQRDQERLGRAVPPHAECGAQRPALRWRQPVVVPQHRAEQLVQAGERQLSLGLDAGGGQHPQAGLAGLAGPAGSSEDFPIPASPSYDYRAALVADIGEQAAQRLSSASRPVRVSVATSLAVWALIISTIVSGGVRSATLTSARRSSHSQRQAHIFAP